MIEGLAMIRSITLKFGASSSQPLKVEVAPLTVFVGPNNSGKSKVLVEIENYCRAIQNRSEDVILDKIEYESLSKEEIELEIDNLERVSGVKELDDQFQERHDMKRLKINKLDPKTNEIGQWIIIRDALVSAAQSIPNYGDSHFLSFLNLFTLRMDVASRLKLLHRRKAGSLYSPPINYLDYLFRDDALRAEVSRIVYEAFGKYFVIDPMDSGQLNPRLSDKKPKKNEEKSWRKQSIKFYEQTIDITQFSDGVKAFCGIMATILAGDPKIILIDEPESSLYPPLSNKLGKEVAQTLRDPRKRFFAATHSSDFLMGCIQSGMPLNIIRLTYNNGTPTARVLPKDKISHLMRNPLLRSTGVLQGLFYESVVVTEGDSDRAFYQEINERLLDAKDPRGIPNCLFVNAQSKQTIWDIIRPLRELGIPALGIVDIDILDDEGKGWTKMLRGSFVPPLSHESWKRERNNIYRLFQSKNENARKGNKSIFEGGVNILENSNKEACQNLFKQLCEYGCFIVPGGEVESWLKEMEVKASKHGPQWLIDMFKKMGDKDSSNYLFPGEGDVWDFIGKAHDWLSDSNRKGIPVDDD